MARLIPFQGRLPQVHPTAFLAETAVLIGDVTVEQDAVVMFGAVLRGDMDRIVLGTGSNLQDNVVVHTDLGMPAIIGADVSVGHNATVHACTVQDECLISMGSTVLSSSTIGTGSLIAAGAVVLEGTVIPPRSLVAGVPARVRRGIEESDLARIRRNAVAYRELAAEYLGEY